MATGQAPEPAAKASVFEDLVDIVTSPAEVFKRRMGSNPLMLIIALAVVCAVIFYFTKGALQPAMDGDFTRATAKALAQNPEAAANIEKGRAMQEKFAIVGIAIALPISMVLTGLMVWLLGKIVGSTASFADSTMVAAYAFIPRALSFVAVGLIASLTDPSKLTSILSAQAGLARFMDPDATAPALFQLAGRVDLFVIWQTILIGIGLSVVGKVSRGQAFGMAALIWLLGSMPYVIPALFR
jgi:hypothetical protein